MIDRQEASFPERTTARSDKKKVKKLASILIAATTRGELETIPRSDVLPLPSGTGFFRRKMVK